MIPIPKLPRWFTWEIIFIMVFIGLVALAHYKFARKDTVYAFKGFTPQEVIEQDILKEVRVPPTVAPSATGSTKKKKSKKWKFEERCREILEKIFKRKFPSVRPDFLKSPATGKNLELDCYCSSLKLAVEYDGKQHAEYTPHFHKDDKWKFVYQVRKDDWKNKKCEEMGITLIRIPHYVPFDKLEEYIKKKLQRVGKL